MSYYPLCNGVFHKVVNLTPSSLVNNWAFLGCPLHTQSWYYHLAQCIARNLKKKEGSLCHRILFWCKTMGDAWRNTLNPSISTLCGFWWRDASRNERTNFRVGNFSKLLKGLIISWPNKQVHPNTADETAFKLLTGSFPKQNRGANNMSIKPETKNLNQHLCRWHQVQNMHIFTKINDADEVKHWIYCLRTVLIEVMWKKGLASDHIAFHLCFKQRPKCPKDIRQEAVAQHKAELVLNILLLVHKNMEKTIDAPRGAVERKWRIKTTYPNIITEDTNSLQPQSGGLKETVSPHMLFPHRYTLLTFEKHPISAWLGGLW